MGNRKIAVLIDSENTPHSKLNLIIEELSSFGQIIVKRAYG
ncbi:NYN domain-containing protein, partial [Vibrio parahaemolyticus]